MLLSSHFGRSLAALTCLTCLTDPVLAQTTMQGAKPATAPSAPARTNETASAPSPGVATDSAPPPASAAPGAQASQTNVAAMPPNSAVPQAIVVPPGYALVPIENAAQTRYDVEYPQNQGALPPGMELPYEDGDPIPPGYRVVRQSRRGLVIAGSIVGGIAYGFSITGAVGADFDNKSGSLLVPVLGPWIMLALGGASDKCQSGSYGSYCETNSGLRSMLVLDGLMQVAGATMLAVGIGLPRTRLVRRDVTVSMAPMSLGRDGYGVGAVGQF